MRIPTLLAIDSCSGLAAGVLTLALTPVLLPYYGWTPEFAGFMGYANLAYGTASGILFLLFRAKPARPPWPIGWMAFANFLWAAFCLFQAKQLRHEAEVLGIAHLALESAYVAFLAGWEADILLRSGKAQT